MAVSSKKREKKRFKNEQRTSAAVSRTSHIDIEMVFGDFYPQRKSKKRKKSSLLRCAAKQQISMRAHRQANSTRADGKPRLRVPNTILYLRPQSKSKTETGERERVDDRREREREREDCGDINDFRNGNIVDIVTLSERPHIFIYADTWTFALTGTESRGERSVAEPTHPGNFSGVTPSSRSPTFLCDFL